jgi:hypothetical protein
MKQDQKFRDAVANRIKWMRRGGNVKKVTIFKNDRVPADAPAYKNPGWLEWGILYEYKLGGQLFVGAIQRTIDSDVEFHS